jgi:hypothetical protein
MLPQFPVKVVLALVLGAGLVMQSGCSKGDSHPTGDHSSPASVPASPAPGPDEATVIKEQLSTYPLQICVVSGEKLGGEMGEAVNYVYQGRLIRFCCKSCLKDFNKDPQKYIKILDEAAEKAKHGK